MLDVVEGVTSVNAGNDSGFDQGLFPALPPLLVHYTIITFWLPQLWHLIVAGDCGMT